jgi:hypothetical protein
MSKSHGIDITMLLIIISTQLRFFWHNLSVVCNYPVSHSATALEFRNVQSAPVFSVYSSLQ